MEALLMTKDSELLPSKLRLLQGKGMGRAGIWQHFGELSVRYEKERRRRKLVEGRARFRLALEAARALVIK
jgi:hypothetical protein